MKPRIDIFVDERVLINLLWCHGLSHRKEVGRNLETLCP